VKEQGMAMVNGQAARFFSVKFETRINGERYRPAMCYPLKATVEKAVGELASQDFARLFAEEVRFVSGAPIPVRKPVAVVAGPVAGAPAETKPGSGLPDTSSASVPVKGQRKKPSMREGFAGQGDLEF
jgi:hypothetical protein